MQISAKQILTVIHVVAWILFIGLCVEAGGIIFNTLYTLFINPVGAKNVWSGADLSNLLQYDRGQFMVVSLLMAIVAVLKTLIFYQIIKILLNKKLDMSQPFNKKVNRFILLVAYLALGTGFFSLWGDRYSEWLIKQGVKMPDIQNLQMGGADVWMFMGVTLFVIAHIFKRGVEIQAENELTV